MKSQIPRQKLGYHPHRQKKKQAGPISREHPKL